MGVHGRGGHCDGSAKTSRTRAAQAWQKTDKNFVDRSFAGQDWFTVRQKMVKKKYASREDAYAEVRTMLATLTWNF